jgi:hypothetical protein
MGLAAWINGTKCADCGMKIQGPKFPRVVFGSQMWVCGRCQERLKTDQKLERDAAEQHRQQEEDAAVRGRSDADIAEVLMRSALRQYGAFAKEVSNATGGEIALNAMSAFMFVLFAESSVFRKLSNLQIDEARVERIHELFVRYALARFIHITVRNVPHAVETVPIDRAALLTDLVAGYRQVAEVHRKNTVVLLDVIGKDPTRIIEAMIGFGVRQFFIPESRFAELLLSDKEKFRRLLLCVVQILTRAATLKAPTPQELAVIATPINRRIEVGLPDSWLLRQTEPWILYYDPCTPQYNLLITVRAMVSDRSPIDVVRKTLLINSPDTEPEMLTPTRASAHYRITGQEQGEAKDDYHWILVDNQTTQLHYALFTLSTLVGRADSNVTANLVQSLHPRIRQAQFLM